MEASSDAKPCPRGAAASPSEPTWLNVAVAGAQVGGATGAVCAVTDFVSGYGGVLAADVPALAAALAALLTPLAMAAGAVGAVWIHATWRKAAPRQQPSHWRKWLVAAVSSLPVVALLFWVPWSWVNENWENLAQGRRIVVGAVYVGMLLTAVGSMRVALWLHGLFRGGGVRLPWLLVVASASSAALCYWADRSVFVGLYEDFHYGLAAGFVLSVALCLLVLRHIRQRSRTGTPSRSKAARQLTASTLATVVCVAILSTRISAVRAPQALLFSKVVHSIQRGADFDGDGYSSFFAGLDCAPFDSARSPALVDFPGNGVDEDCSGNDARWPRVTRPRSAAPAPRKYNLLLITVDTWRADRLSAYGHTRKTSPNLDRLASESLLFEKAYSPSTKTFESVPSILTGMYPSNLPRNYQHRRVRGSKRYMYTLTAEGVTITQRLKKQGYQTRAILASGMMKGLGLDRGFDKLETRRDITDKAKKFLKAARSPFFLWLHYMEPHAIYEKHPQFDFGDSDIDRYDSEVARVDQLIGEVLTQLDAVKRSSDTIVVVTADHGEEFGEHGGFKHAHKLYDELVHVPLIVKVPGAVPTRVSEPVEVLDWLPTVCEVLDLSLDCGRFDGESLWPAVAGQRDQSFGFGGAYSESAMLDGLLRRRTLVKGGFRLILNLDMEAVELYDLRADPGEQRNIARTHPEQVAQMREEMALRPFRRLGEAFEQAKKGDTTALVQALPRVRSKSLLRFAVELIQKHPSPGSDKALAQLDKRPNPTQRRVER